MSLKLSDINKRSRLRDSISTSLDNGKTFMLCPCNRMYFDGATRWLVKTA
ncbi:MAG: hypothetical protein F6K24_11515 [Okeania sp. SIO2D1]|nr:hypothetical protein [Okeania sp. SIO2D1]